uniref:Cilia and flagella associated protein 46 n=1 Tax=Electrophorus electricus TaxID=8005 RepID=A0A4W4GFW9_ELEEL
MDLQIRQYLIKAGDNNDPVALRKAYDTVKNVTSGKTASDNKYFLPELYVLCAEQALQMGCKEITEDCLTMYLESKPPTNQFLCRAYLCQAQLKSPQTVDDLDKAVMYYLKAIEVSKDKPGYHFLVFNASLLYFQSVRAFLRPGWRRHLVSSLTEVLRALEVVQESDYAWRSELMLLLVECLLDAGKEKEAAAYAKVTSDFIEQHKPELHPRIFSTQVVITPPSLSPVTLFITFFLDIPRFGHHSRSPIGCMYYAQLSVLCLMECVCIQAQLAAVGRLDALLQRAVKEGDGQVIQCVCAALWNSCLPLLQPNLRRSIKRALLTLAHALEAINSMLLGVRCPVHAELAGIEEEEERLEPALRHLHKALALDERAQHQQRLSFSLHLLQLRASLHGAPARQEDQAARLIEQVSPPARKWRPMLVSAGIALAPVTFQMALNAEHPAKVSGSRLHVEELAAKAQHHLACEDEVKGHLASLDRGTDDRERLWASLVKVARRQEVWDVCRAACRFCLLYDDGRWKNNLEGNQGARGLALQGDRELLRLLAEVHFITAEVEQSQAIHTHSQARFLFPGIYE